MAPGPSPNVSAKIENPLSATAHLFMTTILEAAFPFNVNQIAEVYKLIADGFEDCVAQGEFFVSDKKDRCYTCLGQCPMFSDREGRWKCVEAGTSCEDFSSYGLQAGTAGHKMQTFVCFAASLKHDPPRYHVFGE